MLPTGFHLALHKTQCYGLPMLCLMFLHYKFASVLEALETMGKVWGKSPPTTKALPPKGLSLLRTFVSFSFWIFIIFNYCNLQIISGWPCLGWWQFPFSCCLKSEKWSTVAKNISFLPWILFDMDILAVSWLIGCFCCALENFKHDPQFSTRFWTCCVTPVQ